MERKHSVLSILWLCLCLAGSLAMAIVFIVLFANGGPSSPLGGLTVTQLVLIVTSLFLTAAGYLILLCGKKAGFYAVLTVAVFSAVCSLIAKTALPALFSFVNPLITWLLLRKRWDRWPKIEEQRTAANRRTRKPKSRKTALILAALPWTGFLGVDRFYLGYVGIGLLKFFTAGVFFVLYILDIVKIARGTMRDKYGRPLV